jgi:hypothetical protein
MDALRAAARRGGDEASTEAADARSGGGRGRGGGGGGGFSLLERALPPPLTLALDCGAGGVVSALAKRARRRARGRMSASPCRILTLSPSHRPPSLSLSLAHVHRLSSPLLSPPLPSSSPALPALAGPLALARRCCACAPSRA